MAPKPPAKPCRSALRAFAAGADVDGRHSGPLAASLVAAAHSRCPDPKPPLLPDAIGDVTALHCAAFVRPLPTSPENLLPIATERTPGAFGK
jgi:hypothetical protein